MDRLRCPKCGRHIVGRSHRAGVADRLLSAVYVYPFRCQLCGRRFHALQWGTRYVAQSERREYERVSLRARVAVVSSRGSVPGEITELSMAGCTLTAVAPLVEGTTVAVELDLVSGERPVAVEAAVVRSVRGATCGLRFARVEPEESLRLRGVLAGLLRSQRDASVPEGPELAGGRRWRRSADVWLAVALVVLLALVAATLVPWFSRCTWGLNC